MVPTYGNEQALKVFISMNLNMIMWRNLRSPYIICVHVCVNDLNGYLLIIIVKCPNVVSEMLEYGCHAN